MRLSYVKSYKNDISDRLMLEKEGHVKIIGNTNNGNQILAVEINNGDDLPWIFLSGTVHGNEPIGAVYLTHKILTGQFENKKFNYAIIPCVNPDGYELHTRENYNKIDLNRDFSENPESGEALAIQKYLSVFERQYVISVDIHESSRYASIDDDPAPDNFYMWELNNDKDNRVGALIVENLYKNEIPTCNWERIFGDKNNNGAIFYPEDCASAEYSTANSFDVFMQKKYTKCAITTETSVHDSFSYRMKTLDIVLLTIEGWL
jgi:hypothetical protein